MAGRTLERPQQGAILSPGSIDALRASGVQIESVFAPNPMQARMCQRLEFEILTAGGKAGGKGQPLSGGVLTKNGYVRMGDIEIGSVILNPDGSDQEVEAIFPLGKRDIFRLNFSDHTSTRVTDDHLWLAICNGQWCVTTTGRIIDGMRGLGETYSVPFLPENDIGFSRTWGYICSKTKGIVSIVPDGVEEAQCIQVSNRNRLYICDDFTVTHNSFGAIFWMVKGNPEKPDYDENGKPILVNMSYVHHPRFLGAVIRLNEKDLADWVDQARPFYEGVLGGTFTKNPAEFRWPSGARIFLGHAQDSNAWTKYAGQNITRFFIDEAGQIRDMQTYDIIRSCCRSLVPELRAQILLTANPDGPGMQWLFDRFIEPKTSDGIPIKHPLHDRPIVDSDGGLIELIEVGENPFTHEKVTRNRVWVPSYITDNPHAMASPDYIATLATMQDPKMRRAYLLGDWKALRGTYFDIFRRETHTYDPLLRPLASWWKASASLDWGFVHESAAYWHKQDPETKQHLIYKEFVTNRTDPIELGAELARQSMSELRVQGSITFHVSHDLYHERIGEFSWIELIGKGVQRVLGEGTCYIPEVVMKRLRDSYQIEGKEWDDGIEERILNKQISGIVFRRAPKARAVGFMYMRSLMRMEPLIAVKDEKPDWDIALRLSQEGSVADYATYLKSFKREMEILPQLLISQACPRLIDAIPKAIHSTDDPNDIDKGHFLGNDSCESARYLLTGIRDDKPTATPRMLDRERQLSDARRRNPELTTADLIWISRGIEQREAESDEAQDGFCLGRSSRGSRYRVVDDVL